MDTRRTVRGLEPKSKAASKKSKSPVNIKEVPTARVTRSKSPARVVRPRASPSRVIKSVEEPTRATRRRTVYVKSDDVSDSSSQSSTPKPTTPKIVLDKVKPSKENTKFMKTVKTKEVLDDSADNEVGKINSRSTRSKIQKLLDRLTPASDSPILVGTPTPSKSRSVSVVQEKEEISDEEEFQELPITANEFDECGGRIGSLVHLVVVALLPISLYYCAKAGSSCSWANIWEDLKNPYTFCNNQSGWLLTALMSSVWLLTCVPVGKVVKVQNDDGLQNYKFTGFFSAFVVLSFLFGLEYYNLDVFSAIYNNIDRFLYMNVQIAFLLATLCYLKVKYYPASVNPYGNSGKFLIDFFAGREINPKLFNLFDIKAIAYHQAVIFILILNVVFIFKNLTFPELPAIENPEAPETNVTVLDFIHQSYENGMFCLKNVEFNKISFMVSLLLSIYALDSLIFEHHLTYSFELTQEGCGASLFLRYATFPFLLALLPRFLLEQQLEISCWTSFAVAVVFAAGLIIKRGSSSLKYNFRLHPYDLKFKGEFLYLIYLFF